MERDRTKEAARVPLCREGATADDLRREADRAVLYGTCLKILRPQPRLKPHLVDAIAALQPGVEALFNGREDSSAQFAREYAAACGASAFLENMRLEYRTRQGIEPSE